jgi:hypothetical protein
LCLNWNETQAGKFDVKQKSCGNAGDDAPPVQKPQRSAETKLRRAGWNAMPTSRSRRNDMAYKPILFALSMAVAASPLAASQPEPSRVAVAPEAPPEARYCLRVDPITGSRMETVQCRTREEWAGLEVDVDQEWADNGVRVIEPARS